MIFASAFALLASSCAEFSPPLGADQPLATVDGSETESTSPQPDDEQVNSPDPVVEVDGEVTQEASLAAGDDVRNADVNDDRIEMSDFIHLDQFGYMRSAQKVAVLANPVEGFNSGSSTERGTVLEVRRALDDEVVYTGNIEEWNEGEVHEQSGDRGWWFDFSSLEDPGTYYLIDPTSNERTGDFEIGDDVYEEVLDASLKVFWFNRGNTEHAEEFGGVWSDAASYVGPEQDTEARAVETPEDPSSARDLSGGWFDAGDTNKYVTFAMEPVHLLLTAYETSPNLFDDGLGIPESGNGIPDIVDEVRWEIDWLTKMQNPDGGVLTKVGLLDFSGAVVPSEHAAPRYYEEVCSSSTIAAAGMFAHAALVYGQIPELRDEVPQLTQQAETAWRWYQGNTKRNDCDPQEVKAGDADMSIAEQGQSEVVAAVYLWALTGGDEYRESVRRGYASTNPFLLNGFNMYAPHQGDALLYYRELPGADTSVVRAIDGRIAELLEQSPLYGFDPDADLYRAYMPDETYHWGSNRVKANIGFSNVALQADDGRARAADHLHYFHGANPLGTVYLSNMNSLGAEQSIEHILHYWFGERSPIEPPPGYVVGGPNAGYSGQAVPPLGQPEQKSYRDFEDLSEPIWELTEPAIYYQASYIRLLAAVIGQGS